MKTFLILFSLILSASCSQYSSPKTDNSQKPAVEISPISNQTAENNPVPANEVVSLVPVKIPAFPTPEKVTVKGFLRNECPNCLKEFGLFDLENNRLQKTIWKSESGK